ncbi:hypothetical protein DN443_05790 [Lactobacillus reuteri]|nr:hypothetical protein [Limosilactobacillus reuteri]MQC04817.1 hypothetical protein [Limosilactobacillus reuteri]
MHGMAPPHDFSTIFAAWHRRDDLLRPGFNSTFLLMLSGAFGNVNWILTVDKSFLFFIAHIFSAFGKAIS